MTRVLFPPQSWQAAATLAERVRSLRSGASAARAFDAPTAARELAAWRAQAPFERDERFARRLEQSGISPAELERVLGEDASSASTAEPAPEWVREIEGAFAADSAHASWSVAITAPNEAAPTLRFLDALAPLIHAGRERLLARAEEIARAHPRAPFQPRRAVDALFAPLPWSLHAMVLRPMVLELHASRLAGKLDGANGAERFQSFVRGLADAQAALRFLAEYPVLARLIVATIERWQRFSAEFLQHLAEDADELRAHLRPAFAHAQLARIDGGAGDAHRGGRSVLVAHFEGGARLVYKPRSLAVDVHFQELLEWINRADVLPTLRTLRVLDRGDHGWVEFVEARACRSRDELDPFYRRQGGLIALLYALEAIDFHYENLIASGEHPVLVDLESLFHARFAGAEEDEGALRLVARATENSVMRIGILPQKSMGDAQFQGVDLSGLGGAAGQLTPERVLQWAGLGTDEMRARRERVAMPGANNLPAVAEGRAQVIDHERELLAGFSAVYRLLMQRRDELLAPGGPIARFAQDSVRCVLRPTSIYGSLLAESFHPEYLRDGLERERFLDRLWLGVDGAPHLERVLASERADVEALDVPVFTTTPASRDVWDSRGARIEGFLGKSGMQLVAERLRALEPSDLARQSWFIHASLATLEISRASLDWAGYPRVAKPASARAEELAPRLVDAARRVGDRLIDLALRDERDVAWMGLNYDETSWSIVPLLEDLYAGSAGILHFLATLGAVTGDARYTELARRALVTHRRRLAFCAERVRAVGGFNGWGGTIWTLAQWSALWNDPELLVEARACVERAARCLDEDEHLDVIGGCAGLIAALRALHAHAPDERTLALARRAGDRLLARATRLPAPAGVDSAAFAAGWFTRIDTEQPITGFSHGAAGISWALCELYRMTGDERYREMALAGVLYERTRLVASEGNWMEISKEKLALPPEKRGDGTLSVAWCYGAPGVGLARLAALDVLDHPFVREDVEIALKTTLARGFGRNHSICHGDLGNLELVQSAAQRFDDAQLRRTALEIQSTVLASMETSGFLCGVPLAVESPSLMNGLAGIGYGLLRAAHPERVPSVLLLEPPRIR